VWEAYQQVKANRGAAGVDEETIAMFEQNLSKNLYKLWNRMSSGAYFPPPVKQVEIPKAKGGTRKLGIPTVSDRIAQTVVKRIIEPVLDPIFHPNSYGYRPGRSAKQAIAVTRKRCWQYDWVVEFDIKAAFDQIDHGPLLKAVRSHIKERWILLYLERWLWILSNLLWLGIGGRVTIPVCRTPLGIEFDGDPVVVGDCFHLKCGLPFRLAADLSLIGTEWHPKQHQLSLYR
jgi:group II intron reverse transcriptase/maturase